MTFNAESNGSVVRRRTGAGKAGAAPAARLPSARQPSPGKLSEDKIQIAVFDLLRKCGKPGLLAWHPKNGGVHQRTPGQRLKNKRLGVEPGIADVHILYEGKFYFLELKTLTGRLDDDQDAMAWKFREAGAVGSIAFGLDDAIEWLRRHELLRAGA